MIYVIGNSHIRMFEDNKDFVTISAGPATAYNLYKKNSTTESNKKLFELVSKIEKENRKDIDSIILVFGETDCRIHIYNQFKKNNEKYTMTELINNTIHNYGSVMQELKDMGINFYVCGIPPAGYQKNIHNYSWYATPEIHSKIYREFNDKLILFCEEKGYRYLDIYSKTVDNDGFMRKKYAEDDVHLNINALPFVIAMLREYGEL